MRIPFVLVVTMLMAACSESEPTDLDALRAPPAGSVLHGMFEGRVPCGDVGNGCERIKVALTLHHDAEDEVPTAYVLEWIHVGVDDQRHVAHGTWTEEIGTPWDADALVYELSDGSPHSFDRFVVINDEVLLFLDADSELRLGTAGYAYALTRTE